MEFPRFVRDRRLTMLAALLLVVAGPLMARADQIVSVGWKDGSPSTAKGEQVDHKVAKMPVPPREEEAAPAEAPNSDVERLKALQVLVSVMAISPFLNMPPDNPPALVTKPPTQTTTTSSSPPGGNPTPASTSPEPTSIVSGLLGTGLAGLFTWLRKRRARLRSKIHDNMDDNLEMIDDETIEVDAGLIAAV